MSKTREKEFLKRLSRLVTEFPEYHIHCEANRGRLVHCLCETTHDDSESQQDGQGDLVLDDDKGHPQKAKLSHLANICVSGTSTAIDVRSGHVLLGDIHPEKIDPSGRKLGLNCLQGGKLKLLIPLQYPGVIARIEASNIAVFGAKDGDPRKYVYRCTELGIVKQFATMLGDVRLRDG